MPKAILLLVGLLAAPAWANPPAKPTPAAKATPAASLVRGVTLEGITEYSLPNGLKVLLFPDPSKQTVTVNITYFVGSRHEDYGETGMAHLLEHLVFKGTPTTPNVPQALTEHGARPNGTTWFDRTNYFETLPASKENLEFALKLEADRMVNSFIARKDLDSEMTVVRNEHEMGENDPEGVLLDRSLATAYVWHNYGKTTIGARSDLENVPIDRLQAFYRRYYQPDNAMLVVAGQFDPAQALSIIAEAFGKIPRPQRALTKTYTEEPTQDGERSLVVRRVGGVQALTAVYHGPPGSHEDYAAVDLLTYVLGDSPSGRLYKALVDTKKAARVSGFSFQLKEPGALVFTAEVRKEANLEAARAAMVKTVEETGARTLTAEEVERARAARLKQMDLLLNASDRVGLQLSEWAALGDWRMLFIHRDRLRKVSVADVQRVAGTYLKPSNRTLGMFIPTDKPDRAEVPKAPDVASLVKDYQSDQALASGEAFDPSPSNIEARTTRVDLSDGLKLAMLPKKTRAESVHFYGTLRLGSEATLKGRKEAAELTGAMLMRGTKKRTRQQLKDELDRLKARLSVGGGATSVVMSGEARRPQLAEVLALATEVLREPAFDPKEFEALKGETLARLESQLHEPSTLGNIALMRALDSYPPDHPLYVPTLEESIARVKAVTLQQLKDFHATFYGASRGELAVVGDFDPAAVQASFQGALVSWRSKTPYTRIPRKYRLLEGQSTSIETPDKANAAMFGAVRIPMRDDHADYPALVAGNFLLGGGFLNSRLATRLRQKDGLSYGAGSYFLADPLDELATLGTYAIFAPQNATRVETGVREELDRVLKTGFTQEELEKGRQGLLQQRQQSRAQDGELVRLLAGYLFLDRKLTFDAELEKRVASLSHQDVAAAIARHVNPSRLTLVKAGDFKKASITTQTSAP